MNKVEAYWQSYATKNGLNLSTPDAWMPGCLDVWRWLEGNG